MCEIYLKLTITTPERRQWPRADVFIINFKHISHIWSDISTFEFEQLIT